MTIAAAGVQGLGRRHLVLVLLALSLALNLCFVGGAVWVRLHAPSSEGPAERLKQAAAQLSLDPQQQAAFDRYFHVLRARISLMHQEVQPLIAGAWSELAKPDADAAAVMQRFDEAAAKRRSFQQQLTSETLAFLATLSPEQRAKFVDLARHHFWAGHPDREHGPGR